MTIADLNWSQSDIVRVNWNHAKVGRVVGWSRGLYVWLTVERPDGTRFDVEAVDVEFARTVERLDGSEVLCWDKSDPDEPDCVCGTPDSFGIIEQGQCRTVGCDPLCESCLRWAERKKQWEAKWA